MKFSGKIYEGFRFFWWFRLIYYFGIAAPVAIEIRSAIMSPPVQQYPVIAIIVDPEIVGNMVRAGIVGIFAAMIRPMVAMPSVLSPASAF